MKKRILNVAVIGLGVGKSHVDFYNKSKLCNLKIVCDFNKRKIINFKKKYKGILATYNSDDISHIIPSGDAAIKLYFSWGIQPKSETAVLLIYS